MNEGVLLANDGSAGNLRAKILRHGKCARGAVS
jgi:hypothetical protein